MRPTQTVPILCATIVFSLAGCASSPQSDGGDVVSDLGTSDVTHASDVSDAAMDALDTTIDTPVTNDGATDIAPTDAPVDGFTPTLTSCISGAGASACLIRGTGDVVCWGRVAELVTDGGMPSGGIATVPGISDAVEIAVGNDYACARSMSGTVQCWGNNRSGMLGDGTMTDHANPAPVVGLTDAIGISTMSVTVCALRSTGHVVCWGENSAGQLGRGTTSTFEPTPGEVLGLTDIVQVSTGEFSSCALHRDGTVSCWGRNYAGALGAGSATLEDCGNPGTPNVCSTRPVPVEGITDAVQISTGLNSACALRATGEVRCWGWNLSGQLGDGTTDDHNTPVVVMGISDATLVRSFYDRKCVIRAGGQPWCWGAPPVGDGTTMARSTPVAVGGVSDVVDLSGGIANTCVLERGGRIACWGQGYAGVLDRMDGGGVYVTATTLTGL